MCRMIMYLIKWYYDWVAGNPSPQASAFENLIVIRFVEEKMQRFQFVKGTT